MKNCRELFPVVGHNRKCRLAVDAQALGKGTLGIVVTTDQFATAERAGITCFQTMEGRSKSRPTSGAGQTINNSTTDLLVTEVEKNHEIKRSSCPNQGLVQMACLPNSSRKSIKQKAGAILRHPRGDNPDGQLIRHQETTASPRISLDSECGAATALGAQQSSSRDMRNAESLRKAVGLGPLS